MHTHPHVFGEQGQINSSADNPDVTLATLIGLSLHDGFKNPGCQPTETVQRTVCPNQWQENMLC